MSAKIDTIEITIDGKKYKDNYVFSDIKLTQELMKPNELRFIMRKKKSLEEAKDIRESLVDEMMGKTIEFFAKIKQGEGEAKTENDKLEFKGVVINYNFFRVKMSQQYFIEVIAYSPDYLLHDNPHCYSFEKKTLKEIVDKVAKDPLKDYDVKFTNDPHITDAILYTVQYNETNYNFLKRMAFRYGEWFYFNGKELVFGKVKKSKPVKLEPDVDIFNYYYWSGIKHMNFKHAQHNYMDDANTNKTGLSKTDGNFHNIADMVYDKSKEVFKKETFGHLKAAASEENEFDEIDISTKVKGFGRKGRLTLCQGKTERVELNIGTVVTIAVEIIDEENKASKVDMDDLLIYSVTHTLNTDGTYFNEFISIPADSDLPPYGFGEVFPEITDQRAVVVDNVDPELMGRVRVQFLWQKEQDEEMKTPWIRIATPYAGDGIGFCFVPEIEEEVMVGFENGNAEKPYVIGALYHGKHKPREGWFGDEDNRGKTIRSRSGQTIQLADWDKAHGKEGDGCICIWDNPKENYDILFSSHEKLIQFKCKGSIELLADGDIILNAGGKIKAYSEGDSKYESNANMEILAQSDMTLNCQSNINIEATGQIDAEANSDIYLTASANLDMKGANVNAKANTALSLKGATAELKGSGSGTVDGGGSLTLKGGSVSIN